MLAGRKLQTSLLQKQQAWKTQSVVPEHSAPSTPLCTPPAVAQSAGVTVVHPVAVVQQGALQESGAVLQTPPEPTIPPPVAVQEAGNSTVQAFPRQQTVGMGQVVALQTEPGPAVPEQVPPTGMTVQVPSGAQQVVGCVHAGVGGHVPMPVMVVPVLQTVVSPMGMTAQVPSGRQHTDVG